MLRERDDVLAPLGERREGERDDVQAVVEVLAESPFFHLDVEVAVRRGDDPHVHRRPLRGADRSHLPVLQHAQELRLQSERHVADLIQEQRPSVCGGDEPLVIVGRAGKGAFAVAEQFRFEQVLRYGGAIDGDEGPLGAAARAMYGAREKLLSRSARSVDENARVRLRDQARLVKDVLHFRALRHEFAPPVLVARAARGPREPQRLLHLLEQVLPVEGLGLKAEDPAPGGGHRVGDRAVRGQDDDRQHRRLLADLVEQR